MTILHKIGYEKKRAKYDLFFFRAGWHSLNKYDEVMQNRRNNKLFEFKTNTAD